VAVTPLSLGRARASRRLLLDTISRRLVVLGGLVIIGSILAILLVIAAEVAPLFRSPTAALVGRQAPAAPGPTHAPASERALGVDEYRTIAWRLTRAGRLEFVPLVGQPAPPPAEVPALGGAQVSAVALAGRTHLILGTSDGRLIPLDLGFVVTYEGGARQVTPEATFGEPIVLDADQRRVVRRLAFATPDEGPVAVAEIGPTALLVQSAVEKKALIGPSREETSVLALDVPTDGEITALALDGRGEDLFVGTSRGRLLQYDLRERGAARPGDAVDVSATAAPITALGFLLGDRTLVVGDGAGAVTTWQLLTPPGAGERRLAQIHRFADHPGAVVAVAASGRNKAFVTGDAGGTVRLHYGTSGETLLSLPPAGGALGALVFAPKGDGVLAMDAAGAVTHWRVDNPHPEVTLGTLFGHVWYEGYAEPEDVWQSTGGTDDFEPKLSLIPLIYGTLKGTFYAMLFAAPLALLAALYVSEFMHPTMKGWIKPAVEIMAAMPSVVLGFLAGLWLAPMIERVVPGLALLPLVTPVLVLLAFLLWRAAPRALRGRVRQGTEALLLVPVVIAAAWLALALGGLAEDWLLGGDYHRWLREALGLTYDQRNSLVVGIAMGFAVIPIIFTIAEDSLANVPQHLRAGSLALGATRWQTALRIVLPTASPGIFSAIMIGFGRAVGETMIVLMATGNTPVMNWSIFEGFRALSANIAVELPEAPEGGSLFRVLFLAAFLLFCLTFAVNTLAELVRLRLRRRYRYL